MFCYVVSCNVMLCYDMLCRVMHGWIRTYMCAFNYVEPPKRYLLPAPWSANRAPLGLQAAKSHEQVSRNYSVPPWVAQNHVFPMVFQRFWDHLMVSKFEVPPPGNKNIDFSMIFNDFQ